MSTIRAIIGVSGAAISQVPASAVGMTVKEHGLTAVSDSLVIDTSRAPWMDVARAEMDKGVKEREKGTYDSWRMYHQLEVVNQRTERYGLMNWGAVDQFFVSAIGRATAIVVDTLNTETGKYLDSVNADRVKQTTYGTEVTPWCAAFVNWCLERAGAPFLGSATAAHWLRFGTPLATPIVGCVTVVRPSDATGSSSGHVGFFVRREGAKVILVGGNQHDGVNEMGFQEARVVGFRWPTQFNHLLIGKSRKGVTA